jgi:hypothetical protein
MSKELEIELAVPHVAIDSEIAEASLVTVASNPWHLASS